MARINTIALDARDYATENRVAMRVGNLMGILFRFRFVPFSFQSNLTQTHKTLFLR
jgi:hypothetical protein